MSDKAADHNPPGVANPLKRRGLLAGAGAAGAAALAATVLPGVAPVPAAAVATKSVAGSSGGYQLTPHVLRYYETTRA